MQHQHGKDRFDVKDPSNVKLPVHDFAKTFIKKINRDDGVMTVDVKKYFNGLMQKWADENHKINPSMFTAQFDRNFSCFLDNLYRDKTQELKKHLPRPTEEQFLFWTEFLQRSPLELAEHGFANIMKGMDVVKQYITNYRLDILDREVYGKAPSFKEALELYAKQFAVIQGDVFPPGFTSATEKLILENYKILMTNLPKPSL